MCTCVCFAWVHMQINNRKTLHMFPKMFQFAKFLSRRYCSSSGVPKVKQTVNQLMKGSIDPVLGTFNYLPGWRHKSDWHTFVLGANRAIREAAAFPALFSSIKLIVELIISKQMIPTKSCQSGPSPWNTVKIKQRRSLACLLHCIG